MKVVILVGAFINKIVVIVLLSNFDIPVCNLNIVYDFDYFKKSKKEENNLN